MSRVTIAEWYRRVGAAWPAEIPYLSDDEAVRAARRLYRFALRKTWRGPVRIVTGNRISWVEGGVLVVNPRRAGVPDAGWKDVVHLLSHCFHSQLLPDVRPHGADHARLEIRMIKEVVGRGWLAGKLKSAPPPPPADARRARALGRLERSRDLLARWQSKRRRAETAIRSYTREIRRLERSLGPS